LVCGLTGGTPGIDYTFPIYYKIDNGCDTSTVSRNINVPSGIVLSPIGCIPYLYVGGTRTATNTVSGGTWSSSNTGIATVDPSTGVVTGVSAGSFTVSYVVTNSCGTTTTATKNMVVLASRFDNAGNLITEEGGMVNVAVYPNPTSGYVTLSMEGALGQTDVIVYDFVGKVVATASSEAEKISLDFNSLPAGTYLVKASNGGNVYTEKVIVQK
jgi:hypothetical protein